MMKRLAFLVAMVLAGSCGSSGGTFVLVHFEPGNIAPTGIKEVDLQLDLNGVAATVQVKDGDKDLVFPSSKALTINSGSGLLGVTAVAHNAAGAEASRGTSWVTIKRDDTTDISVTFGVINPKPGADLAHFASDVPGDTFDFGDVGSGAQRSKVVMVTNTGSKASAGNMSAMFSGTGAGSFNVGTTGPPNCQGNMQLAMGSSCQLQVNFMPTTTGAKAADLTVKADSGAMIVVHFTGNGV